ncbi:hypothetical protein [Streptomyces glaucus]|uniref:hypothetical protein n=1 Tax=Streptomyces glaucus TaxID=284029 RepID=UPI0031D957BB
MSTPFGRCRAWWRTAAVVAVVSGRETVGWSGETVAALGFVFIALPCLAIISFTCFAAFRAQAHKAFKVLAYAFLSFGLACALVPLCVVVWASFL